MAATGPVGVGVIGTGSISHDQHAPACLAAENARLHSVLSRDLERARSFVGAFGEKGAIRTFTDIDRFVADPDLDVVVVASPDALHYDHARTSLEAGKHVLVEKPLTLTPQEGRDLVATAERQKRQLGVGFHLRWHPAIHKIVELLRSGEIGHLRHIDMRWTFQRKSTADWRSTPELSRWWSLSGVGAHCIDLMWLFASELSLTRASFNASTVRGVLGCGNEETTAITATFEEGVSSLILSSVLFPSPSQLVFFGEDGALSAVGILGRANAGELTANGQLVPYIFQNPYVRQLEGFCAAVLSGSRYPVSGEVGLKVLADLATIE